MADITPRMTAREYLLMMGVQPKLKDAPRITPNQASFRGNKKSNGLNQPGIFACAIDSAITPRIEKYSEIKIPRKNKYNAKRTRVGDEFFDSAKESRTFQTFMLAMQAQSPVERVVLLERSRRYLLVPKQEGERACSYVADFVVVFADGRTEVVDTKSDITRKNPLYVLKRKLMLERHNIRILEM